MSTDSSSPDPLPPDPSPRDLQPSALPGAADPRAPAGAGALVALPQPTRTRWQPLRLGLVELFHYDSEEFWFADGHLLLRGNNGTGKSKVLSLTLPFLFDAQLKPSRIEPDGDSGKRMGWNLLMGSYERRIGYAWIEFGRVDEATGEARFLTLGAGLSASAGRAQVDSWYFVFDGDTTTPRINAGLWLTSAQRVTLTRERLRETLGANGQVFESATVYRRAVDERLFRLGAQRYEALIDTLIQLRQPQLSKKPDELALSDALTEALPPLGQELLADVAEAMARLEEDRQQLEDFRGLAAAVSRFETRYRRYAGARSRRQARALRQAQTEYDNASRQRNEAQATADATRAAEATATEALNDGERELERCRERVRVLVDDPANGDARRLDAAAQDARERQADADRAQRARAQAVERLERARTEVEASRTRVDEATSGVERVRGEFRDHALASGLTGGLSSGLSSGQRGRAPDEGSLVALAPAALAALDDAAVTQDAVDWREALTRRGGQVELVGRRLRETGEARARHRDCEQLRDERKQVFEGAASKREQADAAVEAAIDALRMAWEDHLAGLVVLRPARAGDGDAHEEGAEVADGVGAGDAAQTWAAQGEQADELASPSHLAALAEWSRDPVGEDPLRLALARGWQALRDQVAGERARIRLQDDELELTQRRLGEEQALLLGGESPAPPVPYTRGEGTRPAASPWQGREALPPAAQGDSRPGARTGAPLWQLVDFRESVAAGDRAGLEAALEASGLLDAWVFADGRVAAAGQPEGWLDAWLAERPRVDGSLADWLQAARGEEVRGEEVRGEEGPAEEAPAVSPAHVERLLASIAVRADGDRIPGGGIDGDLTDAGRIDSSQDTLEAWVAPDGRFRIGALAGAWTKPAATYIGHAAREQARRRRLDEISAALTQVAAERAAAVDALSALSAREATAEAEWQAAPDAGPLRRAHALAATREQDYRAARDRLAEADERLEEAAEAWQTCRQQLLDDATDLGLPTEADALAGVAAALQRCGAALTELEAAVKVFRLTWAGWVRQQAQAVELGRLADEQAQDLEASRLAASRAEERLAVLRDSIGARVDEIRRRLAAAREAATAAEGTVRSRRDVQSEAGQRRAVAVNEAARAEETLAERATHRGHEVEQLRQFSASGLLESSLPDLEIPSPGTAWTIDPALTLARRIEQALQDVADDDEAWRRIQRQVNEEFTELQRALGALGHQAQGESNDWGLVVRVLYQNRFERPDRLAATLAEEIAQRSELLTANEREILENHLQAEIASEIQRLIQAAERQLDATNRELHRRPTSTGVRFRMLWTPLTDDDGAPVGLDEARRRLLNTGADLWSADDRRVIGSMLQQRIQAERERAEGGAGAGGSGAGGAGAGGSGGSGARGGRGGRDGGGSLLEQLTRALDYRRWHRFRFERWQEGQWRRLSGPASSGERALGLTVPLFAAVASFYSQGAYPLAPRLILLDEAFAGIDDAARAHCMGLIREFDLDFVITSEREWACYAELPGVSICQLQRREGIDAVFVSRWLWNGRSRQAVADPDQRFGPVR